MKYLLFASLLIGRAAVCIANTDSLVNALTKTIEGVRQYDEQKKNNIQAIERRLAQAKQASPASLFQLNLELYEAYKLFKYDSAFVYAVRLQQLARVSGNENLQELARLKMVFILLSAGMYKETLDSLAVIQVKNQPEPVKAEYYILFARYYYDLANYDFDPYYSPGYDKRGNAYLDTALGFLPPASFDYNYYNGLRHFKGGDSTTAFSFFYALLQQPGLTAHQLALAASTLSGIYLQRGQQDSAINLLARAAIADIYSGTKETYAIFNLSSLLFKNGDVKHASVFIEHAMNNASFYGARQRKVQMSAILPLIESEKLALVEAQRGVLIRYSIALTLLALALVGLSLVIFRQVKKLKLAQQKLSEAHQRQQEINSQLEEAYKRLAEVNERLEEANKIKEEYIGYFFNLDSEYFARLDKLKNTIEAKLAERKLDEIRYVLRNVDPGREKEELLQSFDKVFLKLFPNFVPFINSLLREDGQIRLKENELLNTDLRIFALMRMGIKETEKIAQILEYSVKTIYSYKTRIKNKAIVANDEFEAQIMNIKTVQLPGNLEK